MRAWLSASVLASIALLAPRVHAQTRPDAVALAIPTTQGLTAEDAARDALVREGARFGLEPGPLVLVRVVDAHGYTIVELARLVHGGAVSGAPVVVRLRPDRVIDLIRVAPMPSVVRAWPAAPSLADARDVATAAAPFAPARVLDARLLPLVHDDAVIAAFEIELAGGRTERARAWVDASSLALLWLEERTLDALGRVYPRNPTSDAMTTMDLPLTDLTSSTNLTGTHLIVESCDQLTAMCNGSIARAVADASGDFLYDPMPHAYDDAFAEVSAYFHGSIAVDYFHTSHDFTWTCSPGNVRMDVLVNYTDTPHAPYENAMFVPGSRTSCGTLVFGQGSIHDYAYDGDVVYHEYGHAVTDQISALGFFATGPSDNYQPLAINEGTSDYWAATIQGDPLIGESIGSVEGFMGSLRGLEDSVVCPADLFGEGHSDGRIWSSFGWTMRTILGAMRADAIWYTTMASLSGGVTLAQATSTVLATVASEVAMGHVTTDEQTMIMAAATARGLPDCTMFVPLDHGVATTGYSGNSFVTTGLSHGLAPLQYTLQIPSDVTDVEIDVGHPTVAGATTVHFMNGIPVRASGSRVTSAHSQAIGRLGTATYSLADGLTPCSTLYVGLETTDIRTAGESLYSIVARVNTTHETRACPAPRPDAGPMVRDAGQDAGDAGSDGSVMPPASTGCGCGVGTRTSGTGWALLLLASIAMRRRGR
jgi:hypothetical protein